MTVTKDGEPVENASVHATGPVLDNGAAHESSADTNADGQAVLDVYEDTYTVQATGDSGTNTTEIDVTGDTEITIDIAAESDRGGDKEHTLSVTVVDPDGQPIKGATIELFTYPDGEKIATATTDGNGVAEFSVTRGDYEAVVDTESPDDHRPLDRNDGSAGWATGHRYWLQLSPPRPSGEHARQSFPARRIGPDCNQY